MDMLVWLALSIFELVAVWDKKTKKGRTRIRTGVVRIKTESDNHYTIQPFYICIKIPNSGIKVWMKNLVLFINKCVGQQRWKINCKIDLFVVLQEMIMNGKQRMLSSAYTITDITHLPHYSIIITLYSSIHVVFFFGTQCSTAQKCLWSNRPDECPRSS